MAAPGCAIVTGASSGIGAAIAHALSEEKRPLVLLGRDAPRLAAVAQACAARGAPCRTLALDLRDPKMVSDALQTLGAPVDLLVCAAGILRGRPAHGVIETPEDAREVLDTNLTATVDLVQKVLPGMLARRRGEILLVSSLAGLSPLPDAPAYAASKAGLVSYGLALREAVRQEGVSVCVSCPGYVESGMTRQHIGPRPGEMQSATAARKMLRALRAGKALSGFPFILYTGSRIALLAPAWIRRRAMAGLRFHVEG